MKRCRGCSCCMRGAFRRPAHSQNSQRSRAACSPPCLLLWGRAGAVAQRARRRVLPRSLRAVSQAAPVASGRPSRSPPESSQSVRRKPWAWSRARPTLSTARRSGDSPTFCASSWPHGPSAPARSRQTSSSLSGKTTFSTGRRRSTSPFGSPRAQSPFASMFVRGSAGSSPQRRRLAASISGCSRRSQDVRRPCSTRLPPARLWPGWARTRCWLIGLSRCRPRSCSSSPVQF
mmetsp:Transcript_2532/g.7269  ORF Transcript_2532/g.7269 Transcript_2532/m.7269 type:complete len:232 (+) Transcript_2532:1903-2598(+)